MMGYDRVYFARVYYASYIMCAIATLLCFFSTSFFSVVLMGNSIVWIFFVLTILWFYSSIFYFNRWKKEARPMCGL